MRTLDQLDATAVLLEDGAPAWLHPEDDDAVSGIGDWAALLPALDPSTMGWRRRDFYLAGHGPHIFDRNGNGGPTAWWNGSIVGSWTQQPDGAVLVVPLYALPRAAETALKHKAAELSRWLDGDVLTTLYKAPLVRALT